MKVYAVRNKESGSIIHTSSNNATGLYSNAGAAKNVKTQADIRYYRTLDWENNRSVCTKKGLPTSFVSPFEIVEAEITDWKTIE